MKSLYRRILAWFTRRSTAPAETPAPVVFSAEPARHVENAAIGSALAHAIINDEPVSCQMLADDLGYKNAQIVRHRLVKHQAQLLESGPALATVTAPNRHGIGRPVKTVPDYA